MSDQPQDKPQPTVDTPACPPPFPITRDCICLSCQYNLRGLQSDGRCPECNAEIADSLEGDYLRHADPAYLKRLAKGVSLMLWSIPVSIVMGILAKAPSNPWLLSFLGYLMYMGGIWLVSSPDPGRPDGFWKLNARKLTRAGSIAGMYYLLFAVVLHAMQQSSTPNTTLPVVLVLGAICALVMFVSYIAIFVYLRKMALRIPDQKLARHTRIIMWGGISTVVVTIVLWIVLSTIVPQSPTAIAPPPPSTSAPSPSYTEPFMVTCVSYLILLVFGIWWLICLIMYRKNFKEQAELAEENRANEGVLSSPTTTKTD